GARPDVLPADTPLRLGDDPVGLVALPQLDEHLRQAALGLDEEPLLVRPAEPPDGLAEALLRLTEVAPAAVDPREVRQRPAAPPGRADLVADRERLAEIPLRLVGLARVEAPRVHGERPCHRLAAPARLGERLRPFDQLERLIHVTLHACDRRELRQREALELR